MAFGRGRLPPWKIAVPRMCAWSGAPGKPFPADDAPGAAKRFTQLGAATESPIALAATRPTHAGAQRPPAPSERFPSFGYQPDGAGRNRG